MAVVYVSPVTYRCFLGFLCIALLSASGKIPIVTFFKKSCICIVNFWESPKISNRMRNAVQEKN